MDTASPVETTNKSGSSGKRLQLLKWAAVLLSAGVILLFPVPQGITAASWRLLAIFIATIVGSILRPLPGGAVVLLGVSAVALTGALPIQQALGGYADKTVWLVLAAFFMSRGMIKTGLGRRIALLFIRAIGHWSLGLGYALVITDMLLATFIPSNGARSGGIIFPIAKSLSEAYDSRPGTSARRLGAFLMVLIYQCEVVICAMFLTGQAGNLLIAKFASQAPGVDLSYLRWAEAAILPGLISLIIVPVLIYRIFPPEVKRTPEAAQFASAELERLGPTSRNEKIMLFVFALVACLWTTTRFHQLDYAVVALLGVGILLITGVLDWEDVLSERGAWDVFLWYGGLVRMAEALGETGITKQFAEFSAQMTIGWRWWPALALLSLIYFYGHYCFASITAHALAMFTPFLVVVLGAGAPPYVAVLVLAYFSNLSASLTHYGTTPGPIYFGAGYVSQQTWWRIGLLTSIPNILVWSIIGMLWWKLLGLW